LTQIFKPFSSAIAIAIAAAVCVAVSGCATSPLGHPQLQLLPESQMVEMGATAYQKMRRESAVLHDPAVNRYVACVVRHVAAEAGGGRSWEVTVFRDASANAFALPGGKIGVNSGLLEVARNQDQLAAVIGHEVAHVLARHHNARVSAAYATEVGLGLIESLASGGGESGQLMGLLGLGARYGVLMPYSRSQEREADLLGLDLMARAGFDPRASIAFWQNMGAAGGAGAPGFLSTHPSHGARINDLGERMPRAVEDYRRAQRAGRRPDCT
jgi:predicted Zn-dependent protease